MIQETHHMIDNDYEPLDNYQVWQIDRYGNIIAATGQLLTKEEAEEQEHQSESEKLNRYYENQMNDHWNY